MITPTRLFEFWLEQQRRAAMPPRTVTLHGGPEPGRKIELEGYLYGQAFIRVARLVPLEKFSLEESTLTPIQVDTYTRREFARDNPRDRNRWFEYWHDSVPKGTEPAQ
jgi:hypothetical protein